MDTYFLHYDQWLLHYNCSFLNVSQVPLEARKHPIVGSTLLILAVILEVLYLPCLISIHKHAKLSCYNLMRFIGLTDIVVIPINGIFTGVGLIKGWVYCSYPATIYWIGTHKFLDGWFAVCLSSLILAFNRCVDMYSAELSQKLFGGNRVYIWQVIPAVYGILFVWHTQPVLLSSVLSSWFFQPFVGYYDDPVNYVNRPHSANNIMMVISLPTMYFIFFVALLVRYSINKQTQSWANFDSKQFAIFIQILAISSVNVVACVLYAYMQFFSASPVLIVIATYAWFLVHGLPVIIYLSLNKTIRRDFIHIIRRRTTAVEQLSQLKQ
ncbi:hypothetical protein M3Y97_00974300 [Aphelenchoides bicaudatus]|nr:hypothetical protein M3Y97_00974300 [Aphelenchoides bicaudatus]